MKKHYKALTYAPKIEKVKEGKVRTTIRKSHKIKPEDVLVLHGWKDRPYRSPWTWRLSLIVDKVQYILAYEEGIVYVADLTTTGYKTRVAYLNFWHELDLLAKRDGVPNGNKLGEFMKQYKLESFQGGKGFPMQIIHWDWPPIDRRD